MKLLAWLKERPKELYQKGHFSVEPALRGIRIGVYSYDWKHLDLTTEQAVLLHKWLKENMEEVL